MMTQRKIIQMSELWQKGVPAKWIARAFYCAPTTVYHIACNNRDLFPPRRTKFDVDDETKAAVVADIRAKRRTVVGTASEYGVSRTVINRWLREVG